MNTFPNNTVYHPIIKQDEEEEKKIIHNGNEFNAVTPGGLHTDIHQQLNDLRIEDETGINGKIMVYRYSRGKSNKYVVNIQDESDMDAVWYEQDLDSIDVTTFISVIFKSEPKMPEQIKPLCYDRLSYHPFEIVKTENGFCVMAKELLKKWSRATIVIVPSLVKFVFCSILSDAYSQTLYIARYRPNEKWHPFVETISIFY